MRIRELVEIIVRALVDSPDEVRVREIEGVRVSILEITVARDDVRYLIGKRGRNIEALRTIIGEASKGKTYMVEVVDFGDPQDPHLRNEWRGSSPTNTSQGKKQ